jgi:UPF0716 protein FxsA
MIFKLFLLFTTMSLLELALLIWIGQYLGVFATIALVILTAILGASMAKYEGLRVWKRLQRELRRGELPGDTILDGVLIFGGGLTFLTPGFITDTMGLLCLFPPTRSVARRWLKGWLKRIMQSGNTVFFQWSPGPSNSEDPDRDPFESEFPDNTNPKE